MCVFLWAGVLWSVFCAGMGYLFLRRREKCSRLCGKMVLRPRGMHGGKVLRGKGVSFSAQKVKMWPPARENGA